MDLNSMPIYSRMKSCGVQKQGESRRVVSGVLEDELYAMQCEISVDWPSRTIESVQARIKRFTTVRCVLAEPVFLKAEGWKIDSQVEGRIKKELGRNGCRHLAILMVDSIRSLVRAELVRNLTSEMRSNPNLDSVNFVRTFFQENPELKTIMRINPENL